MSAKYRACYWTNGHDTVILTTPEDKDLPDDELTQKAEAEAMDSGIVERVTGCFTAGKLVIGEVS